jgi:heme exporter protein A
MPDPPIRQVLVRGVSRRFGSTWALREVHASFGPGALNLVVGSNGSGKTTLLDIIGTLTRPTSGTVSYEPGVDRETARAHIGLGSHEALLYPDLTARENVALFARIQGVDPAAAWREARERFALGSFAERPVRTNSRGQRQRAALARALLHRPSLVLLDEPSTGLDAEGVARLVGVLGEEVARGAVVLVVTHEPGAFARLPSTVTRLERGRVVTPSEQA